MRIGILTANLGDFDKNFGIVGQKLPENVEMVFHRWTDKNFPPVTGLTPRFQYRIPKMFGWQMFPDCDIYLWLDGSMSLQHLDSIKWFLEQLDDNEMLFFKHPWRKTIKEEVGHIEEKLQKGSKYLTSRYKNGLHKECYDEIMTDKEFVDDKLFASTIFVYRNTTKIRDVLMGWWFLQSRFYSCDQIPLPYILWNKDVKVKIIDENVFDFEYLTFTKH